MSQSSALALLCAARNLIIGFPSWRLTAVDRAGVRDMVGRIDELLKAAEIVDVPVGRAVALPAHWQEMPGVRLDKGPIACADIQGLWISAWLLVGSAVERPTVEQFKDALAVLPIMAREVYMLHRVEGLGLADAAKRLGLRPEEAEMQLSEALRCLHRLLY